MLRRAQGAEAVQYPAMLGSSDLQGAMRRAHLIPFERAEYRGGRTAAPDWSSLRRKAQGRLRGFGFQALGQQPAFASSRLWGDLAYPLDAGPQSHRSGVQVEVRSGWTAADPWLSGPLRARGVDRPGRLATGVVCGRCPGRLEVVPCEEWAGREWRIAAARAMGRLQWSRVRRRWAAANGYALRELMRLSPAWAGPAGAS